MPSHRRDFFRSSLAASTLVSMGAATVPTFLARSALAASGPGSGMDRGKGQDGRVLVVIQLLGGNDGLNTVVPYGHDGYSRGRRALRLNDGQIHKLGKDNEIGLHPGMGGMAKLAEQGKLAVVQGVGYPNPDRSHFRSMEIWESARVDNKPDALDTGWLGRALDAVPSCPGDDGPGLNVGTRSLPLAMRSKRTEVPSVASLEQYKLQVSGKDGRERLEALARLERPGEKSDPLLGFIRRTSLSAYESSRRLEQVTKPSADAAKLYPNFDLARRLELVAQVLKSGFGTRIFYTSLDGFDTHANQLGSHAALLTQLSDSVAAFHKDLDGSGLGDRVSVLVFSEFGRRVAENASAGTDHGAAAPVFVSGPVAQAGLVGKHPSLDDLDDGDLKHHTDFRRVYAALLETWLGTPAAPVIGPGFTPLPLFKG